MTARKRQPRASVPVNPPSKAQIAQRLRQLAGDMDDLAVAMDYFGGFAHWVRHARELNHASAMARLWANEIDDEIEGA